MIHLYAQKGKVFSDHLHHGRRCKFTHFGQPKLLAFINERIAHFVFESLTNRNKVITGIGALFKGHLTTMRFKIAQIDRTRQNIDLRAAIIDIIFPRDCVASIIQKAGQSVAEDRATGVAHMQRTGWIGTDIFYIYPLVLPNRRAAKIFALL